jgi:hypothetical protein
MDAEAIRAFAHRGWSAVAALKETYWVHRFRTHGGKETFRIGQILADHARRVRPDWPTERDRAEDLAHHIELKQRLARTADAVTRR